MSPTTLAANEPKVNGCICQVCAERGLDCSQIAPDGEDICDECSMGIHEDLRVVDDG